MITNTHSYQLLIRNKCTCCEDILKHVQSEKSNIPVINIDEQEHNLPFSIAIFPALILDKKLVSYGCEDIIARLKQV